MNKIADCKEISIDEKLDIVSKWWFKIFQASIPDDMVVDTSEDRMYGFDNKDNIYDLNMKDNIYDLNRLHFCYSFDEHHAFIFEKDCEDAAKIYISLVDHNNKPLFRIFVKDDKESAYAQLIYEMKRICRIYYNKSLPTLDEMKVELMVAGLL